MRQYIKHLTFETKHFSFDSSADLSPIKKNPDSTATAAAASVPPPLLTMKSVDEVIDEGLKDESTIASATNAPTDAPIDAPTCSVSSTPKRPSVGDEPVAEKPKKQFKRRNVALYSTLGTDDG